jgi:hypothetical protein
MKVFRVAAVSAVLVGAASFAIPAQAQMGGGGDGPHINLLDAAPTKTPDQIEQEQARDKAYKESLKTIPNAKGSNDPWGSMRSETPKTPPAKTSAAKAKTKTGSNTPN